MEVLVTAKEVTEIPEKIIKTQKKTKKKTWQNLFIGSL